MPGRYWRTGAAAGRPERHTDTLVVADGFSCREQFAPGSGRRAMHLADVLRMALLDGPSGPSGDLPERNYVSNYGAAAARGSRTWTLIAGLAALAAGVASFTLWRRADA
jgi:hypothetical protein